MTRAHLYRPIQDNQGNIRPGAVVRVLQPGTTLPIIDPLYINDFGPTTLTNPFTANNGVVDIYVDMPQRVRLGIRVNNEPEYFLDGVDLSLPMDFAPTPSAFVVSVVLTSDTGAHWKLFTSVAGVMTTRAAPAPSPTKFWLTAPDGNTWQLGVTGPGAVTTTRSVPGPGQPVFSNRNPMLLPTPDATYVFALTVTNDGGLVTTEA